ncbi:MAG: winged helix-turn-helix transcriptional regulator [Boseongicola sp. SB0673_bin_14]|nr:winged helix-turn-helix transcriptional regulator [Boseongicola sp. SB0673_bin_14]
MPYPSADDSDGRLTWFTPPEIGDSEESAHFVDDIRDWQDAEARLSGELHVAALRIGHLDMLMGLSPGQWNRAAALRTISRLSALLDHPASTTEIGLWQDMFVAATDERARSLAWSAWATNRISLKTSRHAAVDPSRPETVLAFLDRHQLQAGEGNALQELLGQARAVPLLERIRNWSVLMEHAALLSPVARGAFALHAWRSCGLARRHPAGLFEALVVVSGLPANSGRLRDGLPFLPLSPNAVVDGTVHRRLEAFARDVGQSALDIRRHLEDAIAWRKRAMELVTPKRARLEDVIQVFLEHDPVSVTLVTKRSGLSRINASRHLRRLEEAGLVRMPGHPSRTRLYTIAHSSHA